MTIGERIRNKREEMNLTQSELAKLCGYSGKAAISRIESAGDRVSLKQIHRVAKGLGISPAILMGYDVDETSLGEVTAAFNSVKSKPEDQLQVLCDTVSNLADENFKLALTQGIQDYFNNAIRLYSSIKKDLKDKIKD